MADVGIEQLKEDIQTNIKTNNSQAITGPVLQGQLIDTVDTLKGYTDDHVSVSQNTLSIGGNYAGEVSTTYDVTLHNNGTTFDSLEALLSDANLNTLIPLAVRKGGMSIKFVQSSDNKYVQYIYNGTSTAVADFTNVANWEKTNLEEDVKQLSQEVFGFDEEYKSVAGSYSTYDIQLKAGVYKIKNTTGSSASLRDANNNTIVSILNTWTDFTDAIITEEDAAIITQIRGLIGAGSVFIKGESLIETVEYCKVTTQKNDELLNSKTLLTNDFEVGTIESTTGEEMESTTRIRCAYESSVHKDIIIENLNSSNYTIGVFFYNPYYVGYRPQAEIKSGEKITISNTGFSLFKIVVFNIGEDSIAKANKYFSVYTVDSKDLNSRVQGLEDIETSSNYVGGKSENLFNGVYTYGKTYTDKGAVIDNLYYALTDKINVKGHAGEYISINKGISSPQNGYWIFEDIDGNKTAILPQYRRCLIPSGSVFAILSIYCKTAHESDIENVQINFGEVADSNSKEYNAVGGYIDNTDVMFQRVGLIDTGSYNVLVNIPKFNSDTKCFIKLDGFDGTPDVIFYTSIYGNLGKLEKVGADYREVVVPANTEIISVTFGQDNPLSDGRYFRVTFAENLNTIGRVERIEQKLSTDIEVPYAPIQTENFYDYRNFKTTDIYEIYDAAMAKFPNYITKTTFGKDSSNTYDVNGYVIDFSKNPVYTILITCNQHGGSANGDPVMGAYIATKFISDLIGGNSKHNKILNWIKNNVRICIMPAANPWGIDNYSRVNANGVNIVRNFPVSDWDTIPSGEGTDDYKGVNAGDQVETQYILSFISATNPDVIVDNHTLGGVDGEQDVNSGYFFVAFVNDISNYLYYEYFRNVTGYYALRDYALTIAMPEQFYAHGALRDWAGENGYLGGLIEMQWRDNLDNERGFTARIIEMSYFQLLSVFDYYRLYFTK